MKKQRLELGLGLPVEAHECEACVGRLVQVLASKPGILSAHVERGHAEGARLCLHYDPSIHRIGEIRRLVAVAGADLRSRYEHLSIPLAGLRHKRQARLVEGVFAERPGVLYAAVSLGTGTLYVDFDPTVTSRAVLLESAAKAGVATWDEPSVPAEATRAREEHEPSGPFGERSELIFSVACGAFTAAGWVAGKMAAPGPVSTGLFVTAYLLGSWFTWKEVVVALRARRFEIDFLMLLAAAGAAVLGDWVEGALLLFLFSLGHALEGFAMGRARNAIAALARLAPSTALRVDPQGSETEVPVSALRVDDRVLIKPNTRIPVDGFVVQGTSAVNQAPITGESLPTDKRPVDDAEAARKRPGAIAAEHRVFAGTINGPGALTVIVTRLAADSTLARVVRMVAEAETQKGPTQRFTDSFERIFVPVILGGVALLLLAGVVVDEPFSRTFYRAMAVLVAASPCALAIATPSAVLSGVARAARGGVLVKGGAHLESLGVVTVMAFDKTGTLTEGRPRLTDVLPAEGANSAELLRISVAVERRSDHPLAAAIVDGGTARLPPGATTPDVGDVQAIVGLGIRARVGDEDVLVGSARLVERAIDLPAAVKADVAQLESQGRTTMVVLAGIRVLGVLGVMDTPRATAREVIDKLRRMGVERTIMLTGDNQAVADAVARAGWHSGGPRGPPPGGQGRSRGPDRSLWSCGRDGRRRRERRAGDGQRDRRRRHGGRGIRRGAGDSGRGADGGRRERAPLRRGAEPRGEEGHPPEPVGQPRHGGLPHPGDDLRLGWDRARRGPARGLDAGRGRERVAPAGLQGRASQMSKKGQSVRRNRAPSGAAEAMARLGEAGQKSFTRRKAIIEAFFEATEGLTAPDLCERVRVHGRPVSLATVQLTLRRLVEHGLADVHRRARDLARFSPVTSGPGDGRLVCVACRSATPFSDTRVELLHAEIAGARGFAVRGHKLEVYGLCAPCRGAGAK